MGRLFGTDGARGIANKELTCELATNIGRAAAYVLTEKDHRKAQGAYWKRYPRFLKYA